MLAVAQPPSELPCASQCAPRWVRTRPQWEMSLVGMALQLRGCASVPYFGVGVWQRASETCASNRDIGQHPRATLPLGARSLARPLPPIASKSLRCGPLLPDVLPVGLTEGPARKEHDAVTTCATGDVRTCRPFLDRKGRSSVPACTGESHCLSCPFISPLSTCCAQRREPTASCQFALFLVPVYPHGGALGVAHDVLPCCR